MPIMNVELYGEVIAARKKAHAKHAENSIESVDPASLQWVAILGEEFGEVCRALTYDGSTDLRAELIDVLAVASAWVDAIDHRA
jgi:NTP pyrophosphatase (non-canonical NTP hydrolase)